MPFTSINDQAPDTSLAGKFFLGKVVNNDDPLHLDRVQVEIDQLYSLSQGELPWCMPLKTPIFGQGSGFGIYGVPAIGAIVIVIMQNGDNNFPMYIGSGYIKANVNGVYDTPQKYGFVDPSNNRLLVDMEQQNWQFIHSSGATVTIDKDNKVTVTCKTSEVNCEDSTLNASKSSTVNTKTSTINCTTANVKCTTANTESTNFNVKATKTTFNCPTNNFAGLINCQSIATGFGGAGGTATIQKAIVQNSLKAGGVELIGHTHTGAHGETSGPH